ncbi:MAG: beta strand repeat-containing protein [Pyrinomonadaceae bacterium]
MSGSPHKLRNGLAMMQKTAQVLLCFAFILLVSQGASAQSNNIYEIRGTASFSIYHINATTGTVTTLFAAYPGGSSATIAQRPSDGMLFYAINATDGQVYRYNPATPGVAPVALTNTLGAAVPASFRMAFSAGGTLYYMPDSGVLYTINQVTGVATAGPVVTGVGSGGDMAFDSGGTLYVINSSRQLFTVPLGGGVATLLGTITFPGGITPATLGIAFDASGVMRVQTQSPSNLYNVSLATFVASNPIAIGGGTTATGDLATAAVPNPDLSITKTSGVTSVYQGGPVTYTIVVTNKTAAYAVTGTVTDTVPATVTGVTWTCAASAGSACTAASGSGNAINTGATLQPNGTATYVVSGTVAAGATGTLTNTATAAVPTFLTDANPADNSATDSDPINVQADLSVTKTDGVTTITAGTPITYTIVVKSAATSTGASNGSIVTDTVPASITSVTWTCGSPTLGGTCGAASGSGNSISTTANLPVGATVTYTVSGTLSVAAAGTLSNTATVITPASGVSDPTDLSRTGAGNNSATDSDTITAVPNVILTKSVSPSGNQIPGTDLTYAIIFTNSGGVAAQTLGIKDPIPAATDFKVGSVTNNLGTTGLTLVVSYSNDGGATWVYTPASGGGGAPAGYDRSVTNIRWTFTGSLSQTSPNNTGNVGFTARIR